MKIWICFWTYAPLHQGHLDVIMRAKKENDKCLVFVCGEDNDRGCGCWLPLRKRYRLVKKFFEGDNTITVVCNNETSLWLDNSWSEENWRIWLSYIYKQLQESKNFWEITRYVSELSYKKSLEIAMEKLWKVNWIVNNSVVLMDRSENLISWTECRKNPLKNWNKIATTFRGNFSHNILVLWTASEWKTTLVQDIAKYFWLVYSEEYWRLAMEKNLKSDWDLTCKDFVDFLNGQYLLNRSKIDSEFNTWIFISDTDNLVTLMYAKRYTTIKDVDSDPNNIFPLTKLEYETVLEPLAKALQKWTKWDKIFFLTPNNDFVDDGVRYMLQASMEERKINERILCDLLEEFGLMDKVEFLKWWSYYENFCKVKIYIKWLLNY